MLYKFYNLKGIQNEWQKQQEKDDWGMVLILKQILFHKRLHYFFHRSHTDDKTQAGTESLKWLWTKEKSFPLNMSFDHSSSDYMASDSEQTERVPTTQPPGEKGLWVFHAKVSFQRGVMWELSERKTEEALMVGWMLFGFCSSVNDQKEWWCFRSVVYLFNKIVIVELMKKEFGNCSYLTTSWLASLKCLAHFWYSENIPTIHFNESCANAHQKSVLWALK
mgnify:CR=1 FL=1